jgi:capsid protein
MSRFGNALEALLGGTRIGNAVLALFDRYEGAQPSSPQRSYLPAFVRDARHDANSFSRWEMSRKIRYFERNTWLVKALRDQDVKWSVGPNGLQVIPSTGDDDWNKYMLEDYLAWCQGPCLDSTITMPQIHKQIAGECHVDGELFVHETFRRFRNRPSEPAIQLVRSHRVGSPGQDYSFKEETDIVDGVQLGKDSTGKVVGPIGYYVRDSFLGAEWNFRGTDVMHHVFDPKTVGLYRCVTPYHACLNTLHDIDDLELFEMQRAKANAEISNILTNPAGEIPPQQLRQNRWNQSSGTSNPSDSDLEKRTEMYRRVLGSRTIALKSGEKLEQFDNRNPSAATQWYWRYKIGQICSAVGVPMILVFPELVEGMQGTVVRGIYDNAHEGFREKYFIYATVARRMYRFYANWARYNRPKLVDAPADWASCHVIPPRAVNVDIGYSVEATVAKLMAGLTDYDTEAGSHGSTAEVIFRRKGRQVALVKKIAAEITAESGVDVKPEEIAGQLADILQKIAAANQSAATAKQPEEETVEA